ncbi:BrxA/BrxB family bacilliredoxin [Capnocytophaga sp.]|uniref:BrxA/BrxB family bacilliredoxin n=1 Tax=Capnocytophaga sp. TaxID=44737 RepID=UPI0026DAB79D|nr:BrxA/BrxB family bacilliredoxin [Capnocytophaga sp.]MDO5105346.1 BrxA/BrxB family bacilliredoxin [Capnocytophaga sp.]
MYPPELVKPMIDELTAVGFQELKNVQAVQEALKKEGTTLVVVNSVCGCAARNARPAAIMSLQNAKKPNHLTTVFAGVDREATEEARQFMLPFPPSSPSIALFKDGELVHMLERHHIEGRNADIIAENLQQAYDEFC